MCLFIFVFFFFNDTATTEIYTLSLHDALPIFRVETHGFAIVDHPSAVTDFTDRDEVDRVGERSEEHTSELQSRQYLVCRLLLEKKKKKLISCSDKLKYYLIYISAYFQRHTLCI